MNAIDREKLLAWLDDEYSREQHLGKAHAIMRVISKIRSGAFDIKPPEVPEPALKPGAVQDLQKLIGALNGLVQEFYRLSRDYHRIYKGQSEEYDEHAYGKHWAFDEAAQMLETLLKKTRGDAE